MAAEAIPIGSAQAGAREGWFADLGYFALLLLIFVGLSPFAIRDPAALAAGESGFAGAGDAVRQVVFLGVFALIGIETLRRQGWRAAATVPPLLVLLLGWCLLSATWASEPDVSFRRGVLAAVIVVSAMMGVSNVGSDRALALLRYVLLAVLLVNFASIAFVPQAVHLPGETDPGLVGDWRGLYFHKNIAGSVSAITAILWFFEAQRTRRLSHLAIFLAAAVFTAMTHSKSSLGLMPVGIALGLIYRAFWRRSVDRAIVAISVGLLGVVALAVLALDWGAILHALEDPTEFTGRAAIWQGEIAFIADHPFLGSGYGTFADTGAASPLHNYVGDAWVQNISHGHNAYLQLCVTIGGVGLLLSLLVLVAGPLRRFLGAASDAVEFAAPLFAVFTFMVLHNALESDFLEGDSPAWVAFLLVIAAQRLSCLSQNGAGVR